MTLSFVHPREDVLADYVHGSLDAQKRERVAGHLRACTSCQDTLRFLTRLTDVVATPAAPSNDSVLSRAIAARAAGERRILPNPEMDSSVKHRTTPRFGWVAVLAASLALILTAVVSRPHDVTASSPKSELRVSPANARPGDSIRIAYTPSAGLFVGQERLVLRGRLRESGDRMYAAGVPIARVHQVATLHRASNGEFSGAFRLPDSIAFVSLVVEDTAAARVDDNGGRFWEVLAHDANGQPTYDALDQKAGDLMGRSWEAAYATAKQAAALYPNRVDAVSLRNFFDRELLGDGDDSVVRAHGALFDSLAVAAKARSPLSESEIGAIFYSKRTRIMRQNATAADTAEFDYWFNRLTREQPRHGQLAQHYVIDFKRSDYEHPARMLETLEKLYARFAPLSGTATTLATVGARASENSKDDAEYRRWAERLAAVNSRGDSAYTVALALMRRPSLRREGEVELRRLLASSPEAVAGSRGFEENRKDYRRRADDARRVAFTELGRSLIADKHIREGLDTLGIAAQGQWDLRLFLGLEAAYSAAGDSADVQAMRLRLAVDPRTNADTSAAIIAAGKARVGARTWDSLAASARGEMYSRMLDRSLNKQVHGSPAVVGDDGKSHTLRELADNQPTAVIFWSRYCGAATAALPAIEKLTERMSREGKRFVFVVLEPPSAEIREYLSSKHWNQPVYYDARSEVLNAFASFGTPAYYVIDGAGRIRFDNVSDRLNGHAEIIAQMDALRSEHGVN